MPVSESGTGAWAASGAMALTGRPDGPPLLPPGHAAAVVQERLAVLGVGPIPGLLGERAASAGFHRNAPWSCGGAFRVLPATDGHVGLSLSRPSDLDLLPALVEGPAGEPWPAVAEWLAGTTCAAAEERFQLLGLPGGAIPAIPPQDRPGVVAAVLGDRRVGDRPLVVDLTSLWAGPLCARLLGLRGARVVKVESTQRPDGARGGPAAFFDLLHHGHEQVRLDFRTELDQLRALVAEADLVLEASRPRALRQLGIVAEEVVAAGTSWLSLTARGRDSGAVGFGDDIAASAGLVLQDGADVVPVGDAIADPLAGVAAAVVAAEALASEEARLIDVSMRHVVAETLDASPVPQQTTRHTTRHDGTSWWVEDATGAFRVEEPRIR